MNRRIMPVRIWNRGQQIVDLEQLQIEYLDNVAQTVNATVFGTKAYQVRVGTTPDLDQCTCPFFPDHHYCKHIAAVVKLLKSQKRPVENLFDQNSDDLEFKNNFPKNYLQLSKRFETLLATHPEIARDVYLDKHLYDQLRADPTTWDDYFAPQNSQALAEQANTPGAETRSSTFAHFNVQPVDQSGQTFLTDLQLPQHTYFKPLSDALPTALNLEVTLMPLKIREDWMNPEETRLAIKLRVASAADQKFYVINNIRAFLEDYAHNDSYQTGGKRQFKLTPTVFSPSEQQFLMALNNSRAGDQVIGDSQPSAKYFLIPIVNFVETLKLMSTLPNFQFQPSESESSVSYDQIEIKPLEAEDGLLTAQLNKVEDGYDLTLQRNFDDYLEAYLTFISQATFFTATSNQLNIINRIDESYSRVIDSQSRLKNNAIHFALGAESELTNFIAFFKQIGEIEVPTELISNPLIPHFDLDRDQNALELTLSYHSAAETVDEDANLTRDFAMEKQAHDYLHSLQFNQDGQRWTKDFSRGADLYHFFVAELPNLRENGVVSLSPELQDLLQDSDDLEPEVAVSTADGLLAINFSFAGIDESEVDHVLAQLDSQKPFIQRDDGSIIVIDDKLKKVSAALTKIRRQAHGKIDHGQVRVHASQAFALQASLGKDAKFDETFQQLIQNLTHPEEFPIKKQRPVNAKLRPYQELGVRWLEMLDTYKFGGILADEMGLGKTLQMISFLNNHLDAQQLDLIVSPASLIYNWQAEFKKFTPNITVEVVDGSKEHRRDLIKTSKADVLITSYNSARLDIEDYQQRTLDYLVLDEAQYIKNASTKTNQSLRKLEPKNTFALSGTPIENRVEELWAIFALVMPGLLPSKKAFGQLTPAEIAIRVKPFILRREKSAVMTELPALVETNLQNEMTTEQKTVYLAQLKQMQVKVKGMTSNSFVKNKLAILAGLTRLRQICNTPALYLDDYHGDSGKLNLLNEILQQALANERHILIFSQFTSMLDIIEGELKAQDLDCYVLNGSTKPKDRLQMVDAFNAGEKNIFLISLKAGGTGLNLTGADLVILVDLWWNPAVEDQATARAHRIGQTKKVDVLRLITKGTIEEQIYQLQEKKRNFVDQILDGTENKGSLTEDEIRLILGIE